ncbi:DUF420 domain-containing protein [Membranicola marinus]|uniref:DUF420 domain-containing protein n=1 Tax=Membranihabitans marinus TaxID=1227546 RepID=A0A953L9N0_9BACT|nr:DUF420 domain-containing protein [Membranihabitans marinus]MBY5959010.1 DUF420 domain-containing protein [Membranihabitans marinus]
MQNKAANKSLEKKLNAGAIVVSIVVFVLVLMMRRVKLNVDIDFGYLPAFHATLNGLASICLLIAFWSIKNKNIQRHRRFMVTALILSVLFLMSYVVYHFTMPETLYCKEGTVRYIYFFLLISHIILAAVILPFILFTFIRAVTFQFERHKKMARWVFPLWFYVTITGPVLYLMLRDCY